MGMILKCISKKLFGRTWVDWYDIGQGQVVGSRCYGNACTFGLYKTPGIVWLADDLLASSGHSSMELIIRNDALHSTAQTYAFCRQQLFLDKSISICWLPFQMFKFQLCVSNARRIQFSKWRRLALYFCLRPSLLSFSRLIAHSKMLITATAPCVVFLLPCDCSRLKGRVPPPSDPRLPDDLPTTGRTKNELCWLR
jgi:hypothetical protein